MSHEVETMAYANEVPWHGLGAKVTDDLTGAEFLKAAGLDWQVELHPLFAKVGTGDDEQEVHIPGRYALIRDTDKKIMTVTGSSWQPWQNADMMNFMDDYVKSGGATLETAGSLREGKIVWGLARLKHSFEVTPSDRVEGYLLITTPHEVGRAITVRTTSVRVVCANTMALAENNSAINYRQSHLSAFDIVAAKVAIGEAHEQLATAERRAKIIHGLKINAEDALRNVIVPIFDPQLLEDAEAMKNIMDEAVMPKRTKEIFNSLLKAPGAIPDNGWGVLNAVTHWADHVAGHDAGSRMYRSWIGDYGRKKIEVEEKLFEMAS